MNSGAGGGGIVMIGISGILVLGIAFLVLIGLIFLGMKFVARFMRSR